MPNPLVADFLKQHDACADGAAWALSLGAQTMGDLFAKLPADLTGQHAAWVVWAMARDGVLGHHDLVRFAVFCAKRVEAQMPQESKDALTVVEKWLDGKATQAEVEKAEKAAHDAFFSAIFFSGAARAAAHAASGAANAAAHAASGAANAAANAAAHAAAYDSRVAAYAAYDAARKAQAAYAVQTFGNPFKD